MTNINAVVIFANGKLTGCTTPKLIECGGDLVAGYIEPIGDCCVSSSVYNTMFTTTPSTNPNAVYGVWMQQNGEYILVDVKSASNETSGTTMTTAILNAKVTALNTSCACVDCTTPSTATVTGVYNGVFPSTSTTTCFTVAVTVAPTLANINAFVQRYYGIIDEDFTITVVGASSFTAKVSAPAGFGSSASTDTVASVAC